MTNCSYRKIVQKSPSQRHLFFTVGLAYVIDNVTLFFKPSLLLLVKHFLNSMMMAKKNI